MRAVVLIRLLVGWVFVSEGIQKFLFPAALGVGRFTKIGLPHPGVLAPVVGAVEIACGAAVIVGLWTRLASIPLLAVIVTAIVTTKIPELHQPDQGFWFMLHDARTDFSMVLGLLFLLIVGGGAFALTGSRERVSASEETATRRRGSFEELRR
jgi:putative oxidoreductase